MSEQAESQTETQAGTEEPQKKKKGKLPMIIMLAVVLGGGGFFAMKMRGGKKEKPEVKLGAMAELPKEFLVPLRGDGSYLRADVALHFAEGFDAHHLEETMPAIRDAIIQVLISKSKQEIDSLDEMRLLKKEIATKVNEQLHHEEEGSHDKKDGKAAKGHGSEKDKGHGEHAADPKEAGKHADWDSHTGPVLKVYFTTFATQ